MDQLFSWHTPYGLSHDKSLLVDLPLSLVKLAKMSITGALAISSRSTYMLLDFSGLTSSVINGKSPKALTCLLLMPYCVPSLVTIKTPPLGKLSNLGSQGFVHGT